MTKLGRFLLKFGFLVAASPLCAQSTTQTGISPLWTGRSLVPNILAPITTTATSTAGSSSFVVTSSAGIQVGMSISTSFFASACTTSQFAFDIPLVASISGTTITTTCPATATNTKPVPITFGAVRTDPTAASIENSVATNWLLVGAAAQGNTGIGMGYDNPNNMNAQILGNGSSLGLLVGAQSSRMTSGSGTRPFSGIVVMDSYNGAAKNKDSWVGYFQSNLLPGTTNQAQHIQFEHSINNNWNPPSQDEDPYTPNILNNTIVDRLDCGTGQIYGSGNAPNECGAAMDILQNGNSFRAGIIFGHQSLDAKFPGSLARAIAMPPNYAMTWYISPGNNPAKIYGDSSGNLDLLSNGLVTNKVGAGAGLQTAKTSSTCTPANVAFNSCSFGLKFTTAEPDTAYGYACTINAVNAFLGSISSKTTTGLTVNIYATGTGTPTVAEASCIITHN